MTIPRSSIAVPVTESSQIGEVRRIACALALAAAFDATTNGKVGLVVTELATNLIRHAGRGEIILRTSAATPAAAASEPHLPSNPATLEILALDKGPGMPNVDRCLEDGFSTGGSSGTGLGAVQRAATQFDIYAPQKGVAIFCRIETRMLTPPRLPRLEPGVVNLPKSGEEMCGDAWAIQHDAGRVLLLIADGLGHGHLAAEAATEAVRIFREHAARGPAELLRLTHDALRKTRGAAVAVAEVSGMSAASESGGQVRFAGVGNIVCTLVGAGGSTRSLASHNGTVGHELHRVQEFTTPWSEGATLVMHSDGLQTRWQPEAYPGLWSRHPALIAGVLHRDFQRGRDDTTVLVLRRWRPAA